MSAVGTLERQTTSEIAQPAASRGEVIPFINKEPKAYPPKLAKAIMQITREFGAIKKASGKDDPNGGGWNDFHKYGYQKWDDVLERESTLLAQHGIIIQQSEVARSLLDKLISISYEFSIINEEGDCWPDRPVFTAIGRLQDNKGMFDDKAANKCHTQAHKYFLIHLFKIKTKEAVAEDADAGDGEAQETATPAKPPRPGSAEAKALEGPRTIDYRGMSYAQFVDAYLTLAQTSKTTAEAMEWAVKNKDTLAKVEAGSPAEYKRLLNDYGRVLVDVAGKSSEAAAETSQPATPKPPRPGAATPAASAIAPMPDPAKDATGWVKWLTDKLAAFESYEAGEKYWNDTIEALDLPGDVQEEAMGCWRKFEARFEP